MNVATTKKIIKINPQTKNLLRGYTPPLVVAKVLREYKKTIYYLIKKRGVKSALNFILTKLLVTDEGGEISILDPLFRAFPSLAPYPYKIEVEITSICNKKCILCEHTHWNEIEWSLTLKDFKYIVDQFPKLRWINMTGEGSSFLNKDYMEMIKYVRGKDISVNFVDEFEFINEKRAHELIELGVNSIWISMDGATKETYEKIKVGCDFDKVLKNIKSFLRIKKEIHSPLPMLGFRYIVTTLNVHEMPQFIELIASLGNNLGDGSRVEFVGLLAFDEIKHLQLPEIPEEIINDTLRRAKDLCIHVSFAHESDLPAMERCAAWAEPYIMMEGYVLPCCAVLMANRRPFLREHSFGNILEQSFEEIWNSQRYKEFRKTIPRNKGQVPILCSGCRAYDTSKREEKYGGSKGI